MTGLMIRVTWAVFIGLPLITIANVLGYWVTYFGLTICFGCFAPEATGVAWAIEGLALVEFLVMMLYSLIGLTLHVIGPEGREVSDE
jgi:hypothetical protein